MDTKLHFENISFHSFMFSVAEYFLLVEAVEAAGTPLVNELQEPGTGRIDPSPLARTSSPLPCPNL